MILSNSCRATAMVMTLLLVASTSTSTSTSTIANGESNNIYKSTQLRGSSSSSSTSGGTTTIHQSRSLAAEAPLPIATETATTTAAAEQHRQRQDNSSSSSSSSNNIGKIPVPVSPGIADGVNAEDLPCLVATICDSAAQPELGILCGLFTTHLELLGPTVASINVNTFFAPSDDAFNSLPQLVASDIFTDLDVLKNVLEFHSVTLGSSNASPILVEELECNQVLAMASSSNSNINSSSSSNTKTMCFGDDSGGKVQIGDGNLPMRMMPKIIRGDIDACNGRTVMHIVDQVLLPGLPLKQQVQEDDVDTDTAAAAVAEDTDPILDVGAVEDTDAAVCGGIIETVCSTSGLEILCDSLRLVDESDDGDNDDDFLEGVGTFFAPLDSAFDSIPSFVAQDLSNATILENVLLYHAVMPIYAADDDTFTDASNSTTTATTNTTNSNNSSNVVRDILSIDDLECDEELFMMNGETTRTLCLDLLDEDGGQGGDKIQIGAGNSPMRSLPKIIPGRQVETCDGTAIIYVVDQVILPGLPLSSVVEEDAMIEGGWSTREPQILFPEGEEPEPEPDFGNSNTTTIAPIRIGFCPTEQPIASEDSCRIVDEKCFYDYNYNGCTWDELSCIPAVTCVCSEGNIWMCKIMDWLPCGMPELFAVEQGSIGSGMVYTGVVPPALPEGFPQGGCDPAEDFPGPTNNSTTTNTTTIDEVIDNTVIVDCPAVPDYDGACRDDMIDTKCEYDHLYTGCTWDELKCTWTTRCECSDGGSWQCAAHGIAPCGVFMFESNEFIAAELPEGLPWGESCNPEDDLPQAPVVDETDSAVEGRLVDECPGSAEFGSCANSYVANLKCEYDHMFTGCSWDKLSCTPIMECQCDQFDDGKWACMSMSMVPCNQSTTPGDLPWGLSCSPGAALPVKTTELDNQPVIAALMGGGIP